MYSATDFIRDRTGGRTATPTIGLELRCESSCKPNRENIGIENRSGVFDGRLIICEATSRLASDAELIREQLDRLGFLVTDISQQAQFTFIQALRADREPDLEASLV